MKHTAGPLELRVGKEHCFHDTTRVSIVGLFKEEGEEDFEVTIAEVWPADNDLDIIDGQRFIDCWHACENVNPKAVQPLLEACKKAHEALKDIINAADNEMPYSPEELCSPYAITGFLDACNQAQDAIALAETDYQHNNPWLGSQYT